MKKIGLIAIILALIIIGAIAVLNRKSNHPRSTDTSDSAKLATEVTYACENNKSIKAVFYQGELKPVPPGEMPKPSGRVELVLSDGRNFDLAQTISADGGRYANSDESFVFWVKGNGAMVLENNEEKDYKGCRVTPAL